MFVEVSAVLTDTVNESNVTKELVKLEQKLKSVLQHTLVGSR